MRISTKQLFTKSVGAMLEQQHKLGKTQQQVASGKRVLTPADDPTAAVQGLKLAETIALTQQYQANAGRVRDRLSLEESALNNVGNVMQRVRELTVQAGNSTLSKDDRNAIAAEVRQRLDELVGIANTRESNGDYLFAGHQSKTLPFSANGAGGFVYAGDDGQRLAQIGPGRQVVSADSGHDVFRTIANGNGTYAVFDAAANTGSGVINPGSVTNPSAWVADTYTISFTTATTYEVSDGGGTVISTGTYSDGAQIAFQGIQVSVSGVPQTGDAYTVQPSVKQDLFTSVQNLVDNLESYDASAAGFARYGNAMNRILTDIDGGMEHIFTQRSGVGARLNAIDSQQQLNDSHVLLMQTTKAELQDLDYAEAVSRLQLQLVGLQAAQQAFAKVQGLSLFNFLR